LGIVNSAQGRYLSIPAYLALTIRLCSGAPVKCPPARSPPCPSNILVLRAYGSGLRRHWAEATSREPWRADHTPGARTEVGPVGCRKRLADSRCFFRLCSVTRRAETRERKSMSTYNGSARGRTSLVCPECRELSRLKGPHRGFRCPNGHSYPIEALLVLKERRLEALGWTLTALERLERDLRRAAPRGRASGKQHEIRPPILAEGDGRARRPSGQWRPRQGRASQVAELAVPSLELAPRR
jgi:hypothetical protein